MTSNNPATLVQIGMRAAIRDLQEWLGEFVRPEDDNRIDVRELEAYLLAMLFQAGVDVHDVWDEFAASEHGEG